MRKGFTLIEIFFVLGMIAIMLSIILPSFRGIQEESLITKSRTELGILQTAMEAYYNENRTYPQDNPTYQEELIKTGLFNQTLEDPFQKDTSYEYTPYEQGSKKYYVIYSTGMNRQPDLSQDDLNLIQGTLLLRPENDDIIVTNLKLIK